MLTKVGFGALCATLLAASPALAAVTVTNQDSKPHTIVVRTDSNESQHNLAAGQSMQVNCPDNCGFRDLAFGTSRVAGGDAQLVVDKDGELHFKNGHGDFQMPNGSD